MLAFMAVLFLLGYLKRKDGHYINGHRYIESVIGQWVHDPDCPHDNHERE